MMTSYDEITEEERLTLTRLQVKNFRSLHDLQLDIEPRLIMLVGPNASGKSNIIDALSFIVDALYDGVNFATERRGTREILHRHDGGVASSFTIALDFNDPAFTAQYSIEVGFLRGAARIISEQIFIKTKSFNNQFFIHIKEGQLVSPRHNGISEILSGVRYSSDNLMLSVMGDSSFVAHFLVSSLMGSGSGGETISAFATAITKVSNFIGEMCFYHLFPNVMREPRPISHSDSLERDGHNLVGVVDRITKEKGDAYWKLLSALGSVVPDIDGIKVQRAGSHHYIQLRHPPLSSIAGRRGWLDIASESDGTVRALGFFTALYQDPSPTLIGFEEPELAVHVGALGILADTLSEAQERSQIVVTTHSADLLDRFGEDTVRAVNREGGRTRAGRLKENQLFALREALLSAGDIHRAEGLTLD